MDKLREEAVMKLRYKLLVLMPFEKAATIYKIRNQPFFGGQINIKHDIMIEDK